MTIQTEGVVREIIGELEQLPDDKVIEVLDFVRFLRTQYETKPLRRRSQHTLKEEELARLYAESADEDRELAEAGLSDYSASLKAYRPPPYP